MDNQLYLPDREPSPPTLYHRGGETGLDIGHHNALREQTGVLHGYLQALLRRRWLLLLCGLAGLLVGSLLTIPVEPKYVAHTSLDIQSLNENFMNMRAVDPTGASGTYSAESNLQTDIKLLQSEELLDRVSRKMKLESNAMVPSQDLFSRWLRTFGLSTRTQPRDVLIDQIARSIKVKPIGLTRLIELDCESTDAATAAEFCNTLAHEYVDQDFEIRAQTAQQTSTWLTKQVGDVRSSLQRKEDALLQYARQNKILYNQETDSVNQEKLKEDQLELSRAEADRISKQSVHELMHSSSPDSLAPVLDSGPLKEYEVKLSQLEQQKAELTATLTPKHPKVLKLQAQIDELKGSIDREKQAILGRISNDYQAAKARESLLKNGFQEQENIVADEVAKATQFKMLRQDMDSERVIYDSLMQRVREAGLVTMMRATPVRVVDRARVPVVPVSPHRTTSAGLGFLFGSLFGIGFVFWSDRNHPRLQAPGDSQHRLNMVELGVVPSSRLDKLTRSNTNLAMITLQNERSLLAESYRAAMNSILFHAEKVKGASAIVVSSPNVAEGKTTIVCNIGIALAETKRRVILVDGDLRRPRLHKAFGIENTFGLSDVLSLNADGVEIDVDTIPLPQLLTPTAVPNLSIVTCGSKSSANISSLLHSRGLSKLLMRLRREADIVLIDTPPLMHISDARVIGRMADGMVLVFRSRATSVESAHAVQQMLGRDSIKVIGTVLNDFNPASEAKYRYYKSYYVNQ